MIEKVRMLVFLAATGLYLWWFGVPVIEWLTPTNLDGSVWSIVVVIGIGLAFGLAPVWLLHRVIAGRW